MRTNNKNKRFFSLFLVGIIWTALIAAQPAAGQENEEPIELETMEVEEQEPTVRQQVEKDFKASKTTTSISERETRDFNAANPSDALRLIPGVNFTFGEGSRFGNPDAIRGVTGFPTPDAIDGFPVIRSPGTGAEGAGFNGIGSVIPSIAISEIEVARGSQGVMFGGQTEGGIFLTKLKRGRRGPIQGTLYAEYADIREELYMGEIGGATDDGRYDIYIAGRQLVGDYENVVTDRGTRLLKEDILGGLVKAGFEPIKDIRIELLMITNDNEIVAEEVPGMPSINNLDFRFYGISWVHEVFQGIGYEVSYSRVTDENGFLEPGAFQSLRRADQSNLVGSIYVIRQLSDSVGYSGALGIEHAENDALQEILLGGSGVLDLQFEDDSIYFLNTLTYDDRISVNAGLRYLTVDDDGADDDKFIYDVGSAYTFLQTGTTLRATYEQSYTRNMGFLFFINQFGQNKTGNLPIKDIETWEIGIDQRFLGNNGIANLTYFETDSEGMPTFGGSFTGDPFVATKESEIKGVELFVAVKPMETLRLAGSFTYLDSEDTGFNGQDPINVGQTNVPVSPKQAALSAEWQATPNLRFFSLATWEDGGEQTRFSLVGVDRVRTETKEASFFRWNLGASYRVDNHLKVTGKVNNILDERDFGFSSTTVDSLGNVTITENKGDDPGRFYGIAIEWRL